MNIHPHDLIPLLGRWHLVDEHGAGRVLITGHTDTTGTESYNVDLSRYRAKTVHAIIVGDRAAFVENAYCPHIGDKDEKREVQLKDHDAILDFASRELGWPCARGQNSWDYFESVRRFQRCYNNDLYLDNPTGVPLDDDADFGPMTWGAVFDLYQYVLAGHLGIPRSDLDTFRAGLNLSARFVNPGAPAVGCGEFHPIEQRFRDNYRSKTNKRVEIHFFDPDESIALGCFSGGCDGKGCALYDGTTYSAQALPYARWQYPRQCAGFRAERYMLFTDPGLVDGAQVEFSLFQTDNGGTQEILDRTPVTAAGGRAVLKLDETDDGVAAKVPEVADDEDHPHYRYQFIATFDGVPHKSLFLPYHRDKRIFRYYD